MKKFKLLLLCFLLMNILSALTGIKSVEISANETSILYYDGVQRVAPIIASLVLAFFYYGIYRRKRLTYYLGFLIFIVGYIYCIYRMFGIYFEKEPTIISILAGLAAGTFLFVFIIKWWIGSNSYFFKEAADIEV